MSNYVDGICIGEDDYAGGIYITLLTFFIQVGPRCLSDDAGVICRVLPPAFGQFTTHRFQPHPLMTLPLLPYLSHRSQYSRGDTSGAEGIPQTLM